jgi:hypothetical protein
VSALTVGAGAPRVRQARVTNFCDRELARLGGGATLYATPGWLRYCQRLGGDDLSCIAATVDQQLRGLALVRPVRSGQTLSIYDVATFAGGFDDLLHPSAVAAVSGAANPLLVDRGLPAEQRSAIRRQLVAGVDAFAEAIPARSVAFLYLDDEEEAKEVETLLGPPASSFVAAAHGVIEATWPSFDGYLATLSRNRRTAAKRERRSYLDSGLRTCVSEGPSALDERTAALQLQLRSKYGASGSVQGILKDYENLAATVGEHIVTFTSWLDAEVVGLSLYFRHGDELICRLVGFDYERMPESFVYFNLVFYEPILWGIDRGITRYRLGTESYGAKRARGCRFSPLFGVVRWPDEVAAGAAAAAARWGDRVVAEAAMNPAALRGDG